MENNEKQVWYDDAGIVIDFILGIIVAIVVCSQSFAVGGGLSLTLFGSIINHNSIYFLLFIYFILLKFSLGKKYFNYLNVFLIFIYFISCVTSLLTVVQVFSLNTLLSFSLDLIFLLYLVHTFFRGTIIWKEFNLSHSPFMEITNEWAFYSVIVVSMILLAVNLISTVAVSGVIISSLDCVFAVLFGRYIYLYGEYLDQKKIDSYHDGNFDEVKENIQKVVDDTESKIKESIENIHVDEVIDTVKDKVDEVSQDISEKLEDKEAVEKEVNKKTKTSKKSTKKSTSKKKGEE